MKPKLDLRIDHAIVLTMDPQGTVIEDGYVGISGETIHLIAPHEGPPPEAVKVLDAEGGLVLPGLVNAHTHAAMTLFRGLADDLPLMEWLNQYIFPVESRMDGEFVYAGTRLACAEMILSGTTTFCDMYLFEEQVARAAKEAGMRAVVGEVLYDFPSPNYGPLGNGFVYTENLIRTWRDDPLISVAVEPHSLFTCSPELLQRSTEIAETHGVPLIIHVAETLTEVHEIQTRYGRSPVRHLEALGLLGPHLVADHCVHLEEEEMALLAEHRVKVIHNPESNMKLASGVAPIPRLLKLGVTVGLGTDGCASNNDLDLLGEMDTAAKLHKVQHMDPTLMDAMTVCRMATIEGAKALGLSHLVGSLEPGKRADLIVINTGRPHLTPLYNPFSHLVYAARGADVRHCVINGRIVMEDRRLLTLDLQEVLARGREYGARVRAWLG